MEVLLALLSLLLLAAIGIFVVRLGVNVTRGSWHLATRRKRRF